MDIATRRKLIDIQRSIPKRYIKELITQKRDVEGEKMAASILSDNRLSKERARKINDMLEQGKFSSTSTEVDASVTKKISSFMEGRIKDAIQKGELKKADTNEYRRKMKEYGTL